MDRKLQNGFMGYIMSGNGASNYTERKHGPNYSYTNFAYVAMQQSFALLSAKVKHLRME